MSRILLIHDNPPMADLIRSVLETAGLGVVHVAVPYDAFREVLQSPPAMVIIDFHYRHVDGLYLVEKLRSTADLSAVPVFIVSEEKDFLLTLDALDSGVADVVHFPFNEDDLLSRVRKALDAMPKN